MKTTVLMRGYVNDINIITKTDCFKKDNTGTGGK